MSRHSREHRRRSVLAVPGSSDRFLAKAPGLGADMVLLDLEDAVTPAEKADARARIVRAIRDSDWGDKVVAVRVNSFATPHTVRDVIEVVANAGERLDLVVLAKTANAYEIAALDLMLGQVEFEAGLVRGHVGIEALVESAEGVANISSIAASSSRLESLSFGPGDLAASLGMPMAIVGDVAADYPGDHYHAVLMALLVAGRANGLFVVDGPFLGLDDEARLRELASRTRALGFDGKWAIHPGQIEALNEIYSPTTDEIARAEQMLAALDHAEKHEAKGAIRHGGEMFDEVNRKMAMSVLARAGRTYPGAP